MMELNGILLREHRNTPLFPSPYLFEAGVKC